MLKKDSVKDKNIQEELKKSGEIPVHIAIIMDGNGRWAKKRGLPRVAGHKRGVDTVKEIVEACAEIGVKFLTLYTFSTENWKRPKDEVSTLMRLLLKSLKDRVNELNENDIRLTTIGDLDALPEEVQKQLKMDIERTRNNKKMVLNLALSYSGRWELLEAIKEISKLSEKGKVAEQDIDEKFVSSFLTTKDIPDPDLVIRTSGEFRVSNFLLWQIAYSEFVITETFWPDFSKYDLYDAIKIFQKRERRFGKVSEQIKKK
ncbi:MAG TPA: isoprenyl transferase [Ignavibacteriaceae bacterium]|nr:MAG: Ditrans,polycis-undecaprenyl-diphosphate synthase ((2E,6E)-farnesyl-diphosphate specific) [Ignavibacteria bacterium ADurb.Bin266]OQY73345.1 MAG: di-trans,poly-cis-decaprenylcistransferase [Ignavibacteriales bacterium UTCHB2]HQF42616.1 isoprenyl transferase [Ignavibacteriaceae bacterium]HQI41172.1 isoprenyl transferase [Ignavibacteriaceae bacterium]